MKFIECAQGTAEWLAARAGKITASCFADAISRWDPATPARIASIVGFLPDHLLPHAPA